MRIDLNDTNNRKFHNIIRIKFLVGQGLYNHWYLPYDNEGFTETYKRTVNQQRCWKKYRKTQYKGK